MPSSPEAGSIPTPARPGSVQVAAELVAVVKRFAPGPPALDGVSLHVAAGEVLVLLGTSGSGKTTALRLLNGLLRPDAGRVRALGVELESCADLPALRRRIGYVIQEGGLLPHLSVADNVALVPRLLGWPPARRRARALELLALAGLDPERHAPLFPAQLSGGERQRVGIARALAVEPPLLLMDEPFGALDPLTRRSLQDEFRALQRRLGTAVVLVTHDVPEALRLADRVALLDRGRVLQQGPPGDLRERPAEPFVGAFIAAALP